VLGPRQHASEGEEWAHVDECVRHDWLNMASQGERSREKDGL